MHPVYDGYQENSKYGLLLFYKVRSGTNNISSQALHKSFIKKCRWRKVCFRLKNNIWPPDLGNMESFCFDNQSIWYLLYVIIANLLGLIVWLMKKQKQFVMVLVKYLISQIQIKQFMDWSKKRILLETYEKMVRR